MHFRAKKSLRCISFFAPKNLRTTDCTKTKMPPILHEVQLEKRISNMTQELRDAKRPADAMAKVATFDAYVNCLSRIRMASYNDAGAQTTTCKKLSPMYEQKLRDYGFTVSPHVVPGFFVSSRSETKVDVSWESPPPSK